MKRIKWQSQANTPFGLGTLHWSLHFRECTHKSTWHLLVKIMGLAYFSRTIFWCWPTATCAPLRFPELSSNAVKHHQVAVNPQAGPHTVPLRWEKMRCNPPSMKSAFLLFSSTALPLVLLSLLIYPPHPPHARTQTHSPSNFYSYGS